MQFVLYKIFQLTIQPASCFLSKSLVVVGVLESRMDTPKTSEIEKNYFEQIRFRKQTSLPVLVFSGAMRLCSIMFFFSGCLNIHLCGNKNTVSYLQLML